MSPKMNRRKGKTKNPARRSSRRDSHSGFYTPFARLDQQLASSFSNDSKYSDKVRPAGAQGRPTAPDIPPDDDELLFRKAMAGVERFPSGGKNRVPLRPPPRKFPRFLALEELEAYTRLVDLVAGDGRFELSHSDEYVDGAVAGISPKVLKKLRNGYFSYQDHLDLHGLTRQQARAEATQFLMESFAAGRRCVLVIPGRGLNSKDKEPVLKNSLVAWLTHAPLKRIVLAFSSARSYDGGWGAFYVLLRRNEGGGPIFTPAR